MSGLHSPEILICLGLGIFKNLPNDSNVQLKLRWTDLMTRGPELNLKHNRESRTLYIDSGKTHSHVSGYETGPLGSVPSADIPESHQRPCSCKGQLGISVLMVGTKFPSSSPGLQIMKVWAPVWGSTRHTSFSTPLPISCCVSTAPSTCCCVDQRLTHAWHKLTYECKKNSCYSHAKWLLSGSHIKIIWPDKDYSKEVSGEQYVQQKGQGAWCHGAWHGALALPFAAWSVLKPSFHLSELWVPCLKISIIIPALQGSCSRALWGHIDYTLLNSRLSGMS